MSDVYSAVPEGSSLVPMDSREVSASELPSPQSSGSELLDITIQSYDLIAEMAENASLIESSIEENPLEQRRTDFIAEFGESFIPEFNLELMEKLEVMLTKESNDIKKAVSSAASSAGMMNMERSLKGAIQVIDDNVKDEDGVKVTKKEDLALRESTEELKRGGDKVTKVLDNLMAPVKNVVGSVQKEFAKGGEHLGLIVLGVVALAGFLSSAFPKFEATIVEPIKNLAHSLGEWGAGKFEEFTTKTIPYLKEKFPEWKAELISIFEYIQGELPIFIESFKTFVLDLQWWWTHRDDRDSTEAKLGRVLTQAMDSNNDGRVSEEELRAGTAALQKSERMNAELTRFSLLSSGDQRAAMESMGASGLEDYLRKYSTQYDKDMAELNDMWNTDREGVEFNHPVFGRQSDFGKRAEELLGRVGLPSETFEDPAILDRTLNQSRSISARMPDAATPATNARRFGDSEAGRAYAMIYNYSPPVGASANPGVN